MKEIKLLFYRTDPSKDNIGIKQVLYKVTTDTQTVYDFGYCHWEDNKWTLPIVPDNYQIEVHSWANNPDPKWLVEDAKILRI